jgi:hypothetical protein
MRPLPASAMLAGTQGIRENGCNRMTETNQRLTHPTQTGEPPTTQAVQARYSTLLTRGRGRSRRTGSPCTTAVKHRAPSDLPLPDPAVGPSDYADITVINTLDGFNITPRISILFTGEIDLANSVVPPYF